jgi:hypothetical protein
MNHSGIKIIDKGNDGSEWLNLFNLRSEAGGQPARFFFYSYYTRISKDRFN